MYQNKLDLINKYNLKQSLDLNHFYKSLSISIVDAKKNVIKENSLDKLFLISFFLFIFNSNPKFEFKFEKGKNSENEVLIPGIYVKSRAKIIEISTTLIIENQNRIKVFYEGNFTTILIPINSLIQQYELNDYLLDYKFEGLYLKTTIKHSNKSKISTKNVYPFWIDQNN